MKTFKTIIACSAASMMMSVSAKAQCPTPSNQILINGDFECNDYVGNQSDYIDPINGAFPYSAASASMHGWYCIRNSFDDQNTAKGYKGTGSGGDIVQYQAWSGSSAAVKRGGFIFRSTDSQKPLDPNKFYRITAFVKEHCYGPISDCGSNSFEVTRNRLDFNFGLTRVTAANANSAPFTLAASQDHMIDAELNVSTTVNGWFRIETDMFQVDAAGQYWFSTGYFDWDSNQSMTMHIDEIVLEEVCPGTPAEVELLATTQTPCPTDISANCSSNDADAHIFIVYQANSSGAMTGPAYSSSWIVGDVNGTVNFANQSYTPNNSNDPAFPGFQVGNYYGIKVGAGNCSGIWADDVATVQIKDGGSAYFYPTSSNSSNQALLHVGNYGGTVVDWEVSTNNGIFWSSLNTGGTDQVTVTVPQNGTSYRARLQCNGSYFYSNTRILNLYVPPGGGGNNKSLSLAEPMNRIYPNPGSESVIIEMEEESSISIYDAVGKLIKTYEASDELFINLDISEWKNGIYMVHWSTSENTTVARFIKK